MILIVSDEKDQSTNHVIQWLTHYRENFVRINESDFFHSINVAISKGWLNIQFDIAGTTIDLNKIKSFWYRRGTLNYLPLLCNTQIDQATKDQLNHFLTSELEVIKEFIFDQLNEKSSLGDFRKRELNKLTVLTKAKKVGLDIPLTYIVDSKTALKKLLLEKPSLITKTIGNVYNQIDNANFYYSRTQKVSEDLVSKLGESSYPFLVQEEIPKEYEIRVFFLGDDFYSGAIFSQLDGKSLTDYRENSGFTRIVPYDIPNSLKSKLITLNKKLGLNTGSIDLIKSKKEKYVFLEINPVGQFQQVSGPGNYYLEKIIAEKLIQADG